jgi:hypothetical protein
LISVSIQDIQQNPQDTSNFYLSNIYRTIIDPNISSSLPTSPPPFSPPNYAVWVNALWFLSLVISITCALLATLLQQWARRYLKVTQPRYSPHKRARIRAFFAEGVERFLLPWAVEALPAMLHVSLFLFFSGLAVFLWNVNLTIFKLVLSWVGVCTALYGCITLGPIFRHDTPYHTPLSSPAWHIVAGIRLVTFRIFQWLFTFLRIRSALGSAAYAHFRELEKRYRRLLIQGMQKTAEETALKSPPEIDTRAFIWTFDSLDEDHELERFFSALPGFRSSKVVKDPLPDLTSEQQGRLLNTLIGLSDRTSSSDLLPEQVKSRRSVICAKAIDRVNSPQALWQVLNRIVSEDQFGRVQSAEIARLLSGLDSDGGGETTTLMRAIVSSVIARAQRHDDLWFALASDEMGVSESVLLDYATRGDSLPLLILIHVVRQQLSLDRLLSWPMVEFSKVLEAASKFNVVDTSPELQHEFCALWNQIARKVDRRFPIPFRVRRSMKLYILPQICKVYLALHQDADPALLRLSAFTADEDLLLKSFSFPLCDTPSHHPYPYSTPHIHDVPTSTTVARSVPHDSAAMAPASPAGTPYVPQPLSVPVPLHLDKKIVDAQLVDDNIIPASLYPTHQTSTDSESVRDSATSPDPAPAGVERDIETFFQTKSHTSPGSSPSTSSVIPTSTLSLQNSAGVLMNSELPEISAPALPEPVLNDITSSYPSLILLIELIHSPAFPESHCSVLVTTSPGAPPWPTSAPQLYAASGEEVSPKAGSREDRDAVDPPSVNREIQENSIVTLDFPPQAPLPPPATDIATVPLVLRGKN